MCCLARSTQGRPPHTPAVCNHHQHTYIIIIATLWTHTNSRLASAAGMSHSLWLQLELAI